MKQKNKFKQTEIGKIPEEWEVKKLGDIAKFQYGLGESAEKKGKFVYIRITDINLDGTLNKNGLVYISKEKVKDNTLLKKGDVLVVRTGATYGKTYFFNEDFNATYGGFLIKFLFDDNKVNSNFFFQFSRSKIYWHQAENLVNGGAQPQFNANTIFELKIPLPPLPEQRLIASILSSLDDKIELNNKMNKTLEAIGQAIFKKWFIDERKEEWEISTIGNELKTILGGTPSRVKSEYWNGNINWINSGKVNEFRITEPSEKITVEGLKKSATSLLPKGAVVLAITGATLGQVSRLEIDSCANQSVIGILENEKISSEYIYYWIKNKIHDIIGFQTGGAQQHINKTNVENYQLLIPDEKILNKFNKLVKPIFNKISVNCFQNQTLSQIRDVLLPKLMSGNVRVK